MSSSSSNFDCVRVAVRLRPLVQSEINRGCQNVIDCCTNTHQIQIADTANGTFSFNYVFPPEMSQAHLYDTAVSGMIRKLFDGYNVTILAYGQTGSGKTFTMGTNYDGNEYSDEVGVIPRAMNDIFAQIKEMQETYDFTITCSFMELYQEILYDLLSDRDRMTSVVDIREDSKTIVIPNLTEINVLTAEQATDCLIKGSSGRKVGATAMNAVSSRSHAIFTVNLLMKPKNDPKSTKTARFNLVDLAGSERSKKTLATGERFKEGVKINQGLLALGNVISALGGGSGSQQNYVCYRDSKLTRLLQDSLGGNSVTLMIACASPADYNTEETLSTLRYADRAKKIKNKPIVNQDPRTAEIKSLKETIQKLQLQLLNQNGNGGCTPQFVSTADFENYKDLKNKFDLATEKLLMLSKELESTVNDVVYLNMLIDVSEKAIEEITKSVHDIKASNLLPIELVEQFNDLTKLLESYQSKMTDINNQTHMSSRDSVGNLNDDVQLEKEFQIHTNKQIGLKNELGELKRKIALKEELHRKIQLNSTYICDQSEQDITESNRKIDDYLQRIAFLETELANANNKKIGKISEERRIKMQHMEQELAQLRKKLLHQTKQIKTNEENVKRVAQLNKEILEMKSFKVKLVRSMRQESENFRQFKLNKQKELCQLKAKDVKLVNEMKRKDNLNEKQQKVLKRKVEEVAAVNKRLKDLLDRRQKIKKLAPTNTTIKTKRTSMELKTWVDNEVEFLMSIVDANVTLKQLMDERATIKERLLELKSTTITMEEDEMEEHETAVTKLELDLELRNAQISDLQQKVIESDIDNKLTAFIGNVNNYDEAKVMLMNTLQLFVSLRSDFASNKLKFQDLLGALEMSDATNQLCKQDFIEKERAYEDKINELDKAYEDKLSLIVAKCNRKEEIIKKYDLYFRENNLNDISNLSCDDMSEKLTATSFEERIESLREELAKRDQIIEELKSAQNKSGRRTAKKLKMGDDFETDFIDEEEEYDKEGDLDFNDSLSDPTYRGTPISRRTRSNNNILVRDILIMNAQRKRSTDGQVKCGCKGNCSTRLCSCSKNNTRCYDKCRCSADCINKGNKSADNSNDDNHSKRTTESIIEENNENDQNDSNTSKSTPKKLKLSNDSTLDLDITTPRYIYSTKKRKPFYETNSDSIDKIKETAESQ